MRLLVELQIIEMHSTGVKIIYVECLNPLPYVDNTADCLMRLANVHERRPVHPKVKRCSMLQL